VRNVFCQVCCGEDFWFNAHESQNNDHCFWGKPELQRCLENLLGNGTWKKLSNEDGPCKLDLNLGKCIELKSVELFKRRIRCVSTLVIILDPAKVLDGT
jgi:hypothetical protein